MAKSTSVSRSLKIYLDGKEVTHSIKDIQVEMRKVRRNLNNAQVGSDDYRKSMERLGTLNSILTEHKNQLKKIKHEGESLASKAKEWLVLNTFKKQAVKSYIP